MAVDPFDREAILHVIAIWPVKEQEALAHWILDRASAQPTALPLKRSIWETLRGSVATPAPTPSDAEVKQWLDERRMNQYGE